VKIVVLAKPVPDPAAAAEKLGPDNRLDRGASPAVINGNDEYTLEAALQIADAHPGEVEVTLLAMAPAGGAETLRKGLAMGATRGVLVTDAGLAGSDAWSTAKVLAAALGKVEFDLVLAGFDTSDGVGGVVGAAVATLLKLPYLSSAAKIEPDPAGGTVRVRRISATGFDVLEAPMPALIVGTQLLGTPRYPSLKGIMGARSKEVAQQSLGDLGLAVGEGPDAVGGAAARTVVTDKRTPPARGAARVVRGPAAEAAKELAAFLAERRLV
jgi:electron transfer flavoprotein beta subunit